MSEFPHVGTVLYHKYCARGSEGTKTLWVFSVPLCPGVLSGHIATKCSSCLERTGREDCLIFAQSAELLETDHVAEYNMRTQELTIYSCEVMSDRLVLQPPTSTYAIPEDFPKYLNSVRVVYGSP